MQLNVSRSVNLTVYLNKCVALNHQCGFVDSPVHLETAAFATTFDFPANTMYCEKFKIKLIITTMSLEQKHYSM